MNTADRMNELCVPSTNESAPHHLSLTEDIILEIIEFQTGQSAGYQGHAVQETESTRMPDVTAVPEEANRLIDEEGNAPPLSSGSGDAPPSPTGSSKAESENHYETTIELPRDILSAYILLHTTGTWPKLSKLGKGCILSGFAFSFFAQFAVFGSLITTTIYEFVEDFEVDFDGKNFLYNLVSICALFVYLWKDVA